VRERERIRCSCCGRNGLRRIILGRHLASQIFINLDGEDNFKITLLRLLPSFRGNDTRTVRIPCTDYATFDKHYACICNWLDRRQSKININTDITDNPNVLKRLHIKYYSIYKT
jgi:hypothetical protein